MANIVIDIAAEFVGKPAFKSAETSTDKLKKSVKSLAKTLGVAFSVQQVLAFGKASIKAAAADEKAQKQLALALKNVGLSRDVAASEEFIQKLQSEFGIVDEKLRPAFQTLAIATRDAGEAQKLLQIALDISASTGKDLGSVTGTLSKAFLGNNTALGKLGVGISKADLKAKSFDDIMNQLATTFAGSATASANTFEGSMNKLAVASANVKEIIGKGLIDALQTLGEDDSIDKLATSMENFALTVADAIRGVAIIFDNIKKYFPVAAAALEFAASQKGAAVYIGERARLDALKQQGSTATALTHLAELESKYAITTLATKKKLTAEELKQLKAKQLKLAIDKANLALGKGTDMFDIEKISLAAAEINQAKQLGNVTSQAQLLQITNDLARLRVKQSILDLEDALKTKDVEAITAATNRLNKDLGILGALTNQSIKLVEIEKILATIVPKDLINLENLYAAIRLLGLIKSPALGTGGKAGTLDEGMVFKGDVAGALTGAGLSFNPNQRRDRNYDDNFMSNAGITFNPNQNRDRNFDNNVTITVIDKTSGLIQIVQDAVIDNNRYGNNLTYAGAI